MALPDNLLAYYKLDESSGNAVDIFSGKNLTNNNAVGYAPGLINNGADFGGINTNKNLSRAGIILADSSTQSISASIRIRTEISSGLQILLSLGGLKNGLIVLYDFNAGSRRLVFRRTRNNLANADIIYTITLGVTNWYQLIFTYNGSQIEASVNNVSVGVVANSGDGTANWTPGGGFNAIGSGSDFNDGSFSSFASIYADEVGIWNKVINTLEINSLYNAGVGLSYSNFLVNLTTEAVNSIGYTTATGNTTVVSDGGNTITERGVCWALTTNPTITNFKASTPGTIGSYNVPMTGLLNGTLYYVRGYVTNSFGTTYGNEVTFTTTVIPAYVLQKDIGAISGEVYAVSATLTGTLGTVTLQIGSTGASGVLNATNGTQVTQGAYSGINGLIFTRSANFNGTIDDIQYVRVSGSGTINWASTIFTTVSPISSQVYFKRIEDDLFNSYRIYRYLDLKFKDFNGYVTVNIKQENSGGVTTKTSTFVVGNITSPASPFFKKKISILLKNQAIIIGLTNANLNETFAITEFILSGYKVGPKLFSTSKITSIG